MGQVKGRLSVERQLTRQAASLRLSLTSQQMIGNVFHWNGARVRWTGRILVLGAGRGIDAPLNGYLNLTMPTVGATIPGYGGAEDRVTDADGIWISGHENLYAVYTPGVTGMNEATYAIVDYLSSFHIPPNWIWIAGQIESDGRLRVCTGDVLETPRSVTFLNGWANYGSTNEPVSVFKRNGRVFLRGLLARAAATATSAFTVPVGYRPIAGTNPIFNVYFDDNTVTYGQISEAGTFFIGKFGGGANTYCSVSGFSWEARN